MSISTSAEGPEDKVYLSNNGIGATFDKRRGAMTRAETEDRSEHLSPGAVTKGIIELVANQGQGRRVGGNVRQRGGTRYFAAVDAYDVARGGRCPRRGTMQENPGRCEGGTVASIPGNVLTTPVFLGGSQPEARLGQ